MFNPDYLVPWAITGWYDGYTTDLDDGFGNCMSYDMNEKVADRNSDFYDDIQEH